MIRSKHSVSFGPLALILCLALPTGMLSLFSETTTGEMIDLADRILVGRVTSKQYVKKAGKSIGAFDVDHLVVGTNATGGASIFTLEGKTSMRAGDHAIVMMEDGVPETVLGYQLIEKRKKEIEYEVITPISGMEAQGISGLDRVMLPEFEAAIQARRGIATPGGGLPDDIIEGVTGFPPDVYEPNNSIADRTPIDLDDPNLITGMPTEITGLTLTLGDVDYFSFEAPPLTILNAETVDPDNGQPVPDTLLGLFEVLGGSGTLLASDDDGGDGMLSRLVAPLELGGNFSVAVSGQPDDDFSGGDGTSEGYYDLMLELTLGKYLTNTTDQIAGLSVDGTFIEDFVGYKKVGGLDVLNAGVPADGWSLSYDVTLGSGITSVFGGSGDFLVKPGFTHPSELRDFSLGEFTDAAGTNPHGAGTSSVIVFPDIVPPAIGVIHSYEWSVDSATLNGAVTIGLADYLDFTEVVFDRLLDIDLFGEGDDSFSWSFDPAARAKAYAVGTDAEIGSLPQPARMGGPVTDDLQAALVIDHGQGGDVQDGRFLFTSYPLAFTLVCDYATEAEARQAAIDNLTARGMDTWVVAVDADPETGLYAAFGAGLGQN